MSRTPVPFPIVTVSLSLSAYAAHVGGAFFGIVTARLFQRHLNGAALAH